MIALLLSLLALQSPALATDFPSPEEFAQRIRHALKLDDEIQKMYVFIERKREVKMSKLGKVVIGPLRGFEVHASDQPGRPTKRLIEIEGKPLPAQELAERDAEQQRERARENERNRQETPPERAVRLKEADDERRRREALLDDAMAVFQPSFVARETSEGRRLLVADLTPRPDARVTTREGKWMTHVRGRVWVDEANGQVVKLDMRAFEDVTIGWGIVGRIHEGSSMFYQRRYLDGLWVPSELTYRASGRTLLFRPFEFVVSTSYSDFKRVARP